ncbi:SAM-dependent methyltransferase [Fodinicola acaciae]|uniref:SAM-dependent methyltransferase n=1 Tax=Fodinicola acaciae TaxID=2681555 RepID=UPI0013D55728|nr:SAM-dependent methyltransferase [Fodinicola acaciae]
MAVEMADVSWTALGVAMARAAEDDRPDPLFHDPLAAAVIAAGGEHAPFAAGQGEADLWQLMRELMGDYVSVRTKYFDDYLLAAGCRQAVLVAAGFDARAFRLDWPADVRVFELDMPQALRFKEQIVERAGVRPRCERVVVPTDLREDWPAALRAAGFDPGTPTAWLAEGLLPYLSVADNDRLIAGITELSAPESQLSVEYLDAEPGQVPELDEVEPQVTEWFRELWKGGVGMAADRWLGQHGWDARIDDPIRLGADYGRAPSPMFAESGAGAPQFVTARLVPAR